MSRPALLIALALAGALLPARFAAAQAPALSGWQKEKCARYSAAWTETLKRRGLAGLGQPFLEAHEAFLASGCTRQGHVCPRAPAELEIANRMTILAMNAGMASTFLPFACGR